MTKILVCIYNFLRGSLKWVNVFYNKINLGGIKINDLDCTSTCLYFSFCELDGILNPLSKLAQNLHNLQIQEITPGNAQKYVGVKGTSFVSFGSHASLDTLLTQISTFSYILSNIKPNKACSKNVGIDKHWTKDCASFYLFPTVIETSFRVNPQFGSN